MWQRFCNHDGNCNVTTVCPRHPRYCGGKCTSLEHSKNTTKYGWSVFMIFGYRFKNLENKSPMDCHPHKQPNPIIWYFEIYHRNIYKFISKYHVENEGAWPTEKHFYECIHLAQNILQSYVHFFVLLGSISFAWMPKSQNSWNAAWIMQTEDTRSITISTNRS